MKNIILIGMPGSGKSSIAKMLAQKFSCGLFDTDIEIKKLTGKNIPDIFSEHGEKYFREHENKIISQIPRNKNFIIALGGGAPILKKNIEPIKNLGIAVYLFHKPNEIYKHLLFDYERPLIKKNLSAIKFLFFQRHLLYLNCCHFVLNCSELSINDIAEKLFVLR